MPSALLIFLAALATTDPTLAPLDVPPDVATAEANRVAAVSRASEATVAIFDSAGKGGGSGVIVSADGFALTNFHVVAGSGPALKCGLPDGVLYDAVLVGIDPVGDLALVQLLGRNDFPVAAIGDSDDVRVGDWAFAAGNPFLLADDFTPSVSYGMISGVRRYQYPAGTLLEYTDCLQTDAAINPGNSGGPLFNADGELIGINGRGSFEKRGRKNVGVGYAISVNQAMRFLSHLKSGRILDHASLGATVATEDDGVIVDDILDSSDAFRRGLRYGDEIVMLANREITTANALQNILGVFPPDWRVPVRFRRDGRTFDAVIRLASKHDPAELVALVQREAADPSRPPGDEPQPDDEDPSDPEPNKLPKLPDLRKLLDSKPKLPKAIAERYIERRGFANYWYNQQAQQRLWSAWQQFQGDDAAASPGYDWLVEGHVAAGGDFILRTGPLQSEIRLPQGVTGAIFRGDLTSQLSPPGSGGLLLAVHLWQRMLDEGLRTFGEVVYLGRLPCGDAEPAECLSCLYGGVEVRLFFDATTGAMISLECYSSDDADPCELHLSDFRETAGRMLPHRWTIRSGDREFATLEIDQFEMAVDGLRREAQ
ncbi:MAG: serine protease [Planctomycetaceae bacterium]|nr:serine protease [Planctomycetaceae bacterium]